MMTILRNLRRFWRWFFCDHWSCLETMSFDGHNITACRRCGRCWMHTDGTDRSKSFDQALRVIDCKKVAP